MSDPLLWRNPDSVSVSPGRTDSAQSLRTALGGTAEVPMMPMKMPVFTPLSERVRISESPACVSRRTVNVSIVVEL